MDKYELKTRLDSLGTMLGATQRGIAKAMADLEEIRNVITGLYELAHKEAVGEFHTQLRELLAVVDEAYSANDGVKASTGDASKATHDVEGGLAKIEEALRAMLK